MGVWWSWIVCLLAVDFEYYWAHRFMHTSAILWAGHSVSVGKEEGWGEWSRLTHRCLHGPQVHHSSDHYNLSTA